MSKKEILNLKNQKQKRLNKAELEAAHQYVKDVITREKVKTSKNPQFIVLGALPATGKSTIVKLLKKEYEQDGGMFNLDTDEIRTTHPQYKEIISRGEKALMVETIDYAHYVRYCIFEECIKNNYNVSYENIFIDANYLNTLINYFNESNIKTRVITLIGQKYFIYSSLIKRAIYSLIDSESVTTARSIPNTVDDYNNFAEKIIITIKELFKNNNISKFSIFYRFFDEPKFNLKNKKNIWYLNDTEKANFDISHDFFIVKRR